MKKQKSTWTGSIPGNKEEKPATPVCPLYSWIAVVFLSTLFTLWGANLLADAVYDCGAPENRDIPVTIEIVLHNKWKNRLDEVKASLQAGKEAVKVRPKIFPFLDPPSNIGIGKCVSADQARMAIEAAVRYYGKLDRLIRQDILPHHWVKIGSTDTAELAWVPVLPEDLNRLTDSSLTTEQFQQLYRQLSSQKEKRLPFGMGTEKIEEGVPPSMIEVLSHDWHPDEVWERIGKTKFIWKATVRNNSDQKKRVYVYYDLLDTRGVPLARNVTNQFIEPHQTIEVTADSYIESVDLPKVKSSRVALRVGS
mgnify:CR=1 FL=1